MHFFFLSVAACVLAATQKWVENLLKRADFLNIHTTAYHYTFFQTGKLGIMKFEEISSRKVQRADLTCDVTSIRLRLFDP